MLRPTDLIDAAARVSIAMKELEQRLNAADARLGDGDTGGMLARLTDALAAVPEQKDLGLQFTAFGKAALAATGSSLGTVCASALLAIGRETAGRDELALDELGRIFVIAREAMQARGQAALGDKTVVDLMDSLAQAVAGKTTWPAIARSATIAVDDSLECFRTRPIRIGRARMFGERTIGIDDPGMLAFAMITKVLSYTI